MIKVLPYKGKAFEEIRPAYFLKAFGEAVLDMKIFSFGRCNYSCAYCKRDGANKDGNYTIQGAIDISEDEIYQAIDRAIDNKQVIRLSGGDPVCYPSLAKELLKYAKSKGGITSIAHNGSSPQFVEAILRYLDFASIDFKATSYRELSKIAGIDENMARTCFANTIKTIRLLQDSGIYTDVRTCVFDDVTYEQLLEISKCIQGEKGCDNLFWTLRAYSSVAECDKVPKSHKDMLEMAQELSKSNPELKIGVRDKWEPTGFAYFLDGEKRVEFPINHKPKLITNTRRGGPVLI